VIDVNLKNADSQIVITGEINNRHGPYKVNISRSVNFTSDNIFPPISNATVVISGNGLIDTLSENEPGSYFTHIIEGKPGQSYSLNVAIDGKIFTATSVMPQPVRIDSLTFLEGNTDNHIYPVVNFQDPRGVANYYQFIEFANGERFKNGRGNSVFSDRLSDGRYISTVLYDDSTDIKRGSILTVQMNCVDASVYNYLQELLQISGGGGFSSPAPDNPTSNISGGALGYFSANTIATKTVELPH